MLWTRRRTLLTDFRPTALPLPLAHRTSKAISSPLTGNIPYVTTGFPFWLRLARLIGGRLLVSVLPATESCCIRTQFQLLFDLADRFIHPDKSRLSKRKASRVNCGHSHHHLTNTRSWLINTSQTHRILSIPWLADGPIRSNILDYIHLRYTCSPFLSSCRSIEFLANAAAVVAQSEVVNPSHSAFDSKTETSVRF